MVSASAKQKVLSLLLGRPLWDQGPHIWNILKPHPSQDVVAFCTAYCAILLQHRGRRDAVHGRQIPFSPPVQIHDSDIARESGIDLLALLVHLARAADLMHHQHQPLGRYLLCNSSAKHLVLDEPDRHAPIIEHPSLGDDVPQGRDRAIRVAGLYQ
jgi:hypothetical protein